jgi:hypothetical protein
MPPAECDEANGSGYAISEEPGPITFTVMFWCPNSRGNFGERDDRGLTGGMIHLIKQIAVALREFLRDIRTEVDRSHGRCWPRAGSAPSRLNPAQEPLPVRL